MTFADRYANGTLRVTSRQGIQFHGVLKGNLKATIAGINNTLLTTLAACGDVGAASRDGTSLGTAARRRPRRAAGDGRPARQSPGPADRGLSRNLAQRSRRSNAAPAAAEHEPLYGQVYLPRKFKTGLAFPDDNSIDVFAQDLGLLAIVENEPSNT